MKTKAMCKTIILSVLSFVIVVTVNLNQSFSIQAKTLIRHQLLLGEIGIIIIGGLDMKLSKSRLILSVFMSQDTEYIMSLLAILMLLEKEPVITFMIRREAEIH